MAALVAFVGLNAGLAFAAADVVDKLSIQKIIKMKIERTEDGIYNLKVLVCLSNKGKNTVRIRDAEVGVRLEGGGEKIKVGTTRFPEVELARADPDGVPSTKDVEFTVELGGSSEETVGRMIALFNMICNPKNSPAMLLGGKGVVGIKVERGWVYQDGVSVDLKFVPSIQREVLVP